MMSAITDTIMTMDMIALIMKKPSRSHEVRLEAHMHEQAATVSAVLNPGAGESIRFDDVVSAMRQIAREVEAAGGVVGHIKAIVRHDGSFAHASVTSACIDTSIEGDMASEYGEGADIQLVAIALLVSQCELLRICESILGNDLARQTQE